MHSSFRRIIWLAILAMLVAAAWAASPAFVADVRQLTAGPHRLAGSAEGARAAEYLAARMRAIGLTVVVQEFTAPRLTVKRCELVKAGGAIVALQPMRPNGIIPPVTPPEGIRGALLYAGTGELREYGTRNPLGRIVVLDYNCGIGWLRAFRLGARAVICLPPAATADGRTAHFTEANANLPRFYCADAAGLPPDGSEVVLHSEVVWERAVGRNVIGVLPGANPVTALGREAMLIGAAYDSFGDVPTRSPGARGAANCAAVLAIAETMVAQPPKRDVAFVCFDAQAIGHSGAMAFYRALRPEDGKAVCFSRRKASQVNESAFLARVTDALAGPAALTSGGDKSVTTNVLRRLERFSALHVYGVDERIRVQNLAGEATGAQIATLSAEKDRWNELRRAIARAIAGEPASLLAADRRAELEEAITLVRADVKLRQGELEEDRRGIASDGALRDLLAKDKAYLTLHTSLLLGDTTSRWGLVVGGDSAMNALGEQAGQYNRVLDALRASAGSLGVTGHFDATQLSNTRLLLPAPLVHAGEIAERMGIFGLALGTVQERFPREGTPDDTPATLDLDRVELQATEAGRMLLAAASSPDLTMRRSLPTNTEVSYWPEAEKGTGRLTGPNVKGFKSGSAMPDSPFPGTVVQITPRTKNSPYLGNAAAFQRTKIPAFCNYQILIADGNACYGYGPVSNKPDAGIVAFAASFDARGEPDAVADTPSMKDPKTRLNLVQCVFRGKGGVTRRVGAAVLVPQTDADISTVMQGASDGILNPSRTNSGTQDGVTYWYAEERVKDIKLFGLGSAVFLGNGTADRVYDNALMRRMPTGAGFGLIQGWTPPPSALQSAADLWRLDQYRMNLLVAKGVINSSVAELHGRAEDLLAAAAAEPNIARQEALASSSFMAQRSVYTSLRSGFDDLVSAAIILLALAVPFAFALERLIVGATNIYRQIGWFVAFFMATFLVLLGVHPVFAVSTQPVIIFLAFALVALSSLVILVIMQKFETELKVLQGLTGTVHAADVSRMSTAMAAMSMGISSMRRRPLRTALTALTITLLTFTILNFASFDTRTGIVTLFEGAAPAYTGAYAHKVNWANIDPEVAEVAAHRWPEAGVTTRLWLPLSTAAAGDASVPLLTRDDGAMVPPEGKGAKDPTIMRGVLGLDPRELDYREDLRGALGVDRAVLEREPSILLTKSVADRLGVAVGDAVRFGGLRLRLAHLLDPVAVSRAKDLDNNGILPVDFSAMTATSAGPAQTPAQQTGADVLAAAQSKQEWVDLPVDAVAVVDAATARALGATLRGISVYTKDTATATAIGEDLTRMLPMPVAATRPDGAYTHVLAPTMAAKGWQDLLFPILLGGLVIFGTMLGSVADREKEIYTFSALGLAPTHVATLFFAEAMVYSFIGGLGGYLLAQGVMKLLGVFADLGWTSVPEMNYSSFNAIITILIVMCTVLVSAIYPAIKASRSANPGVLRAWRLPAPDGDRFHIVFPFTVSAYDITGVVTFLKEHFDNFTETGLGAFMARDTAIIRDGEGLGLSAVLALAPFDLGVTQGFVLRSAPSEIPGIDVVTIDLERLSGQQKDWERLNKVLLDDLRRQFLLWRALPAETMELYRHRTLEVMGEDVGTFERLNV